MKRLILPFAVLILATPVARAEEFKLATVDLQRALNECDAGKKAKEDFKTQVDKLQAELNKQKTEIEKIKEDVEKKGMVLKDEERKNIERDYQKRLREFQRTYKDSQAELQQRDNELTTEILRQLQEVIAEYGAKQSFTLVLEASNTGAVLYNSRSVDITDQVIQEFNSKRKGGVAKTN
ncbi:MAG TPA: OmpH family outer membrane protein [Candidatus Binatia bacterium]|jgi:outer membrane protein|nr:OmpH family outer membrane protein [Candidatus Binatia bacterium]